MTMQEQEVTGEKIHAFMNGVNELKYLNQKFILLLQYIMERFGV